MKKHWLLFLIFFLALALRLYKLGSLPFNPHEDEILSGYVGRFILENGVDLYGNKWPLLYFNKFGDYYIILPMYLAGLSSFLFGVNAFAIRFPAAFIGSLIVFPLYYLTLQVFKDKKAALIAALLGAITPWHLVLSRSSVEGIIGSTIFLGAIVCVLEYIRNKRNLVGLLSVGLFFLSYWIYHPFRIYTPLVLLPLPILFASIRKDRRMLMTWVVTAGLFFLLTFGISSTEWGSGRFEQTSIFSDLSGVTIRIQEQIYNSGNDNIFIARLFHNKVIGFGREFIAQYLTYFSPVFLFLKGGAESRFDVPDNGLYFITYLMGIISACFLGKYKGDKPYLWYFLYLLVIAPIPAALTYYGSPNIHRAAFFGVLLLIPIAYGFAQLLKLKYVRLITVGLVLLVLVEFGYFWHQYSVQADVYTGIRRNDAFKELALYTAQHKDEYDLVYLPAEGNTALYYLYFTQDFNPKYASQFKTDARIDKVGNVQFLDATCPTEKLWANDFDKKILVVNRHSCGEKADLQKVTDIKGRNPLLGFTLYTTSPAEQK